MNSGKTYDLEERTFEFADNCGKSVKSLKSTISNIEDVKQLVRPFGSVGANYTRAKWKFGRIKAGFFLMPRQGGALRKCLADIFSERASWRIGKSLSYGDKF